MSKFISTSKTNPCPHCGKPDWCYSLSDTLSVCKRQAEPAIGWYQTSKTDREGDYYYAFGNPKSSNNFDSEAFKQRQKQLEQQRLEKEKNEQEKNKHKLSISEIDKYIRLLHSRLGLSQEHRQQLINRGYTPEQIEDNLFFSVYGYQKCDFLPSNFSGTFIDKDGDVAIKGHKNGSIACVAFHDGLAVGIQLRNPTKDNKYTWLSSKKSYRYSAHLKEYGELPITHLKSAQQCKINLDGLVELFGTDINPVFPLEGIMKPNLARYLHGVNVIGASGFNFTSSQKQVKKIVTDEKYNVAVLPVDGGLVDDRNLIKKLKKNIDLFESVGCKVAIAWWGQYQKSDGDFDELKNLNKVRFITPDQFTKLTGISLNYETPTKPEFTDPELGKVTATGEEAIAKAKESIINLTDEEINECFEDHTAKKPKKELTAEKIIDWVKKKRRNYYKSQIHKRLKPDVTENSRYCTYDVLKSALPVGYWGILNIKSAKGTAKSVMIGRLKDDLVKQCYEIISLVPRVALADEQSNRWDLTFINNAKNKYESATEDDQINLCFDSLHYLTDRALSGHKICLIIDEIHSSIEHLLSSSTLRENRNKILREFERLVTAILQNQGLIICSDADLNQSHNDYIQNIADKNYGCYFPVFTYENTFKYEGRETIIFDDKNILLELTDEFLIQNKRLIIPIDSLVDCKAIAETLTIKHPHKKIVAINSESIADDNYYRQFVTNPNETILREKPDVLLYTGSMGMGVSVDDSNLDVKFFDYVICFANGTLAPDQVRQQIWRYRRLVPILLYCVEKSHRYNPEIPLDVKECEQSIIKLTTKSLTTTNYIQEIFANAKNDQDALEQLQQLISESGINNVHLKQLARIMALRNYEFLNYRECLINELRGIENNKVTIADEDYFIDFSPFATLPEIENTSINTSLAKEVRDQKKVIKIRHSVNVSQSDNIDFEVAKQLASKNNLTKDDRLKVEKAFLKYEFGDLADSANFCFLAARDKKNNLNRMKLGYFLQHPEIAKFYERKQWDNFHRQSSYGIGLITDIKKLMPRIKLLRKMRIHELVAEFYDEEHTQYIGNEPITPEKLTKLKRRWLRLSQQIKEVFGYTFNKNTELKAFLERILNKIGFKINKYDYIEMLTSKDINGTTNLIGYFWHDVMSAIQTKYDNDYQEAQKHNYYDDKHQENVTSTEQCYENLVKNAKFGTSDFCTKSREEMAHPLPFEADKKIQSLIINHAVENRGENNTTTSEKEVNVTFTVDDEMLDCPVGFLDDENKESVPTELDDVETAINPDSYLTHLLNVFGKNYLLAMSNEEFIDRCEVWMFQGLTESEFNQLIEMRINEKPSILLPELVNQAVKYLDAKGNQCQGIIDRIEEQGKELWYWVRDLITGKCIPCIENWIEFI